MITKIGDESGFQQLFLKMSISIFLFCSIHTRAQMSVLFYGFAGTGNCDATFNMKVCNFTPPLTYYITPNWNQNPPLPITGICSPTSFTVTIIDGSGANFVSLVSYYNNQVFNSAVPDSNFMTAFSSMTSSTTLPPLCNGMLTLDIAGGIPPYSITWFDSLSAAIPNETNDTLQNICSGNYSFNVMDSTNYSVCLPSSFNWQCGSFVCNLGCFLKTFPITCANDCDGRAVLNVVSNGQTISFQNISSSNQSASDSIINACADNFSGQVTDISGAIASCSNSISNPLVLITQIDSTSPAISNDGTVYFSTSGGVAPYLATLNNGDSLLFSLGQQNFDSLTPGFYTITVIDSNGCTLSDSILINSITGLPELKLFGVKVYPNPFSGSTTFSFEKEGEYELRFFDVSGKLFDEVEFAGTKYQYKREHLVSGIYYFTLTNETGNVQRGKLLIE